MCDQAPIGTLVDIEEQPAGFGFKLLGRIVIHVSNGWIVSAACLVVINKNMPATLDGPVSAGVIPISVAGAPPITVIPITVRMREIRTREMWMRKIRI